MGEATPGSPPPGGMIEAAFEHDLSVTYWVPVEGSRGLEVTVLAALLHARLHLEPKYKLLLLTPEEPHAPFRGRAWVRPGQAVLLRQVLGAPIIPPAPVQSRVLVWDQRPPRPPLTPPRLHSSRASAWFVMCARVEFVHLVPFTVAILTISEGGSATKPAALFWHVRQGVEAALDVTAWAVRSATSHPRWDVDVTFLQVYIPSTMACSVCRLPPGSTFVDSPSACALLALVHPLGSRVGVFWQESMLLRHMLANHVRSTFACTSLSAIAHPFRCTKEDPPVLARESWVTLRDLESMPP